jgi:sigma-B regulation protein RsbU (phosphoserine phosphatase)
MTNRMDDVFREQLRNRRSKLETAATQVADPAPLRHLLAEVDEALERIDAGNFGLCEVCHDPVETERLLADPLIRVCLDHMTPSQQRALESDLELASIVQNGLLPDRNLIVGGFQISHRYDPAGPVSGDYCDLVTLPDGGFYFMLGDVAGKGVAASMLMSQLHAIFRTLTGLGQPLDRMLAHASRIFCGSTLPTQYATLVCGRAAPSGDVELCNAGHLPPMLARGEEVALLGSTGLPIGLFCNQEFTAHQTRMVKGDTLVLFTDGASETRDSGGAEYGIERLAERVGEQLRLPPQVMITNLVQELAAFSQGAPRVDDLSIMVLRRVA